MNTRKDVSRFLIFRSKTPIKNLNYFFLKYNYLKEKGFSYE